METLSVTPIAVTQNEATISVDGVGVGTRTSEPTGF